MKTVISLITLFAVMGISAISLAMPVIDFQAAIGGWMQIPSGKVAYPSDAEAVTTDDLNFDTETKIFGRALIDLPVLPSLYIIAAPMTFEGEIPCASRSSLAEAIAALFTSSTVIPSSSGTILSAMFSAPRFDRIKRSLLPPKSAAII